MKNIIFVLFFVNLLYSGSVNTPINVKKKVEKTKFNKVDTYNLTVSTITFNDATVLTSTKQIPTTFLGLQDTPSSYSGQGGKFVRVRADTQGLEFADVSGGGDNLGNHTATMDLNMSSYSVNNVSTITFNNGAVLAPENNNGISLGVSCYGNYNYGVGIGRGASNNYNYGIGIGQNAFDNMDYGIGIGNNAFFNGWRGIGIGSSAKNNYDHGIGIGLSARDNYFYGIGIGYNAYNNESYGIGIGYEAQRNLNYGIGIGFRARNNAFSIGIGYEAEGNEGESIGIGYRSRYNRRYSVSVGGYTFSASSSVSLGWGARCERVESVSLGVGAKTTANKSTSIGCYTVNNDTGTVKLSVWKSDGSGQQYVEFGRSDTTPATYISLVGQDGNRYYLYINTSGVLVVSTTKP